jgi:hypothetical protein
MGRKRKLRRLEQKLYECLEEIRDLHGKDAAESFALAWMRTLARRTDGSSMPIIMQELLRVAGLGHPYRDADDVDEQVDAEAEQAFNAKRAERERREAANPLAADELIRQWCATDLVGREICLNRLAETIRKLMREGEEKAAEACERASALLHGLSSRRLLFARDVLKPLAELSQQRTVAEVIPTAWQDMVIAEIEEQKKAPPASENGWWIDTLAELLDDHAYYQRNRVSGSVMLPKEMPEKAGETFLALDTGVRQWGDTAHIGHLRSVRIAGLCLFVLGSGEDALVYKATRAFPLSKLDAYDVFGEGVANWVVGDGAVGLDMAYLGTYGELHVEYHDEKDKEREAQDDG